MSNRNRGRSNLNFPGQTAPGISGVAGDTSRTRSRRKLGTATASDRGLAGSPSIGGGDFDFVGDMQALGIELGPNVNRSAVNHYIRTRVGSLK